MISLEDAPFAVIHVPHASTEIPPEAATTLLVSAEELQAELLAMTDSATDLLFELPPALATTIRFPYSRLVVDPERFVDDAQEEMAKVGMGAIYTRTSTGAKLREELCGRERQRWLDRYYHPHHARLRTAVSRALERHGACLVIDAHSFASKPLRHEPDQAPHRPEICIGTDDFHTPDWLKDAAVSMFEAQGFEVAVNRPFAGALVPMDYYRVNNRVLGVMIEVNRGLYTDEKTGAWTLAFNRVREDVCLALERLIEETSPWLGSRPDDSL